MWLREEERHKRIQEMDRDIFPNDPPSLPIWTGLPEVEARGREEYLATPPEDLPDDEIVAVVGMSSLSIEQASRDLLERVRQKARRDAKSFRTFRWYEEQFRLGLVAPAINLRMRVTDIRIAHIEKFCEHWCNLTARAR
jgi:hypothetical protein